jgi:eukaryotic-like serine/threonine-protein kinase
MAAEIEPGQVLAGKYEIQSTLGEGGMGLVLAAYDTRLERRVAIKLLKPELASNKEASERFVREARAAAKIQSEYVARVIDVDLSSDEMPLLVMEYLEGRDLEHVIAERGALPVADVALWIIQACDAIADAHAQRIVHRDLKPANVFLARQAGGAESVKVLDFGISKLATTGAADLSLTRTSALMGSPLYMSPEQMRSTRDVDTRTDIWALGAILHEALSGNPPFLGETITQLSANVLLEEPERLDTLRPDLPAGLGDVVWRALRKDPAERYTHVGELAFALLPFAPPSASAIVERIQRVLLGSGLVQESFMIAPLAEGASVRAGGHAATLPPSPPLGASIAAKARTLANFVQTGDSEARKTAPLGRAIVALGLLAGAAGLLVWRSPPATAARPAAGAVLAAPSSAASGVPAPLIEPGPSPASRAEVNTVEGLPSAPEAAASVAPTPAPLPTHVPARVTHAAASGGTRGGSPATSGKRAAAATSQPSVSSTKTTTTTTTRRVTSTESSTYSGSFKSKFGSRK